MHSLTGGAQSLASFPDGSPANMAIASAPPLPLPQQQQGHKGPASGAYTDLLGLESELTSIQVSFFFSYFLSRYIKLVLHMYFFYRRAFAKSIKLLPIHL